MHKFSTALALSLIFFVSACQKNTEQNDLAKAQKCLDDVPEGQFSAANACLPLVQNYSDQQADILKCSIIITSGGIMEDKMVTAYNVLQDSTQTNKTASFMAVLNLDQPDIPTGYSKAQQANTYCQASGVPGLMYISGIILTGTAMNATIAALGNGTGIDISSPSSINSAVSNLVSQCGGASPPTSCTTDLPTLGSTATAIAGSYCTTPDANSQVCGQITSAVNSSGGNSAAAGQALFCYLNNKTYNPTSGQCQ